MQKSRARSERTDLASEHGEGARDQILDSAIKVFSVKGFEGASLREIAGHAGVNHALIKYYFGGKEQLWKAAVDFMFQRQLRELDPEAINRESGGNPQLKLHALCEQLIRYWARHPEHGRLVSQASMAPGPGLDWILEQTRTNHAAFRSIFEHDPTSSEEDTVTTVAILYLLVGACQYVFNLEHEVRGLYGIDVTDPAFVDRFVELALPMLVPPLGAEQSGTPVLQSRRTRDGLELKILIPDA